MLLPIASPAKHAKDDGERVVAPNISNVRPHHFGASAVRPENVAICARGFQCVKETGATSLDSIATWARFDKAAQRRDNQVDRDRDKRAVRR